MLLSLLEKRLVQLEAEIQITAKVPMLKAEVLVLSVRLLPALQSQGQSEAEVWMRPPASGWSYWR